MYVTAVFPYSTVKELNYENTGMYSIHMCDNIHSISPEAVSPKAAVQRNIKTLHQPRQQQCIFFQMRTMEGVALKLCL